VRSRAHVARLQEMLFLVPPVPGGTHPSGPSPARRHGRDGRGDVSSICGSGSYDFDGWEPPDDDDDPFNPPGFMSVQSWQTTSSGMAVAVYQPASTDCPGDDDPPPCDEKVFGDEELQAIMESLDEQGLLQELMDDSNATSDQGERREQGGWIVQNDDGTIGIVRFHEVTGADIEYFYTRIRGVSTGQMPENTIGMIHTHPFTDGERILDPSVIEEYLTPDDIEKRGGMDNILDNNGIPADTRPSTGDKIVADILSDLHHIMIDRVSVNIYEAEGWDSEAEEFESENHDHFDNCGFFLPQPINTN